jgi:hypothetical protein
MDIKAINGNKEVLFKDVQMTKCVQNPQEASEMFNIMKKNTLHQDILMCSDATKPGWFPGPVDRTIFVLNQDESKGKLDPIMNLGNTELKIIDNGVEKSIGRVEKIYDYDTMKDKVNGFFKKLF